MTFDEINRQARPYPAHLLHGLETGLCLFSAAFLGWNDVIHFARKGLATTCVDTDGERLAEMRAAYPSGWVFSATDAFAFAEEAFSDGRKWDAVSVDPFLGNAENRVRRMRDVFLGLARHVAIIGIPRTLQVTSIDGWNVSVFPRSQNASWLVCRA